MDWSAVGDLLRDRPGEWALVTTRATASAARAYVHQIRTKRLALGVGQFEARNDRRHVYARYIGDQNNLVAA